MTKSTIGIKSTPTPRLKQPVQSCTAQHDRNKVDSDATTKTTNFAGAQDYETEIIKKNNQNFSKEGLSTFLSVSLINLTQSRRKEEKRKEKKENKTKQWTILKTTL